MITLLRWSFKLFLLLILLLGGAWLGKDAAVKYLIESRGQALFGAPVSIRKVSLVPFSGEAELAGFEVGNPPGFSAGPAFRLERARVVVDLATLRAPALRVREVTVTGAHLFLEAGKGGVNLLRFAQALRGDAPAAPPASERRYLLDRFEFTGGRVRAAVEIPGLPRGGESALPDVRLTDIGRKSGGETLRELLAQIFDAVGRTAAPAGKVEQLKDRLKGVLDDRLRESGRDLDDAVRDAGKKAGDRLKKLIK